MRRSENRFNCVFLAIPLPHAEVVAFQAMIRSLKELNLNVTFQKPDTPHLTLVYFGDLHPEKVETIADRVEVLRGALKPFRLRIDQIGTFGTERHPRVFWMAPEPSAELTALQRTVAESVGGFAEKSEGRPFHAHMTVARIKGAKRFLARRDEAETICRNTVFDFEADRIRLYVRHPETGERQFALRDFTLGRQD